MTYQIDIGGSQINFIIQRKAVKNINLTIRADGTITITADEKVPQEFIYKFVEKKASWIKKQMEYYRGYQSEKHLRELVSGETIKYLGKQYRLKVEESTQEYVKYYRGYIYIYVMDKSDYYRKQNLLEKWLYSRLDKIVNELYDDTIQKLKKYNVPDVNIKLRTMKTRWGSCVIEKQKIILNKALIEASKYCIEYVILHELVHFIYPNHVKEFYDFLYVLMPDWEYRKKILDEEIAMNL